MVMDTTVEFVVRGRVYDAGRNVGLDADPDFRLFGFLGGLEAPAPGLVRLGVRRR